MMDAASLALLAAAAFGAGVLNAIAGGGSFLTFPALVFTGVPPIVANATSALAVSPGYLGSVWGFRPELRALDPRLLRREALVAATGGVVRDAEYGADITLKAAFPAGTAEKFQARLTELSAGSLTMTAAGEEFLPGPREEAN